MSSELLCLAANESLVQIQESPTRENNVLDLMFTNRPGLVKNNQTIPGISDHDIVIVDSDIRARINKSKPRKVFRFKDADWNMIREDATELNENLLTDFDKNSVDENWEKFKVGIMDIAEKHVPSKMTSTRYNLPWINRKLRRLTRKKQKLYNKARKSRTRDDWVHYKAFKKNAQAAIQNAHTEYIKGVLDKSMEEKNPKPFWKYIKQQRKDTVGIAPLKPKGKVDLITDSKAKAECLNEQFQSVFTKAAYNKPLRLDGDPTPPMKDIIVEAKGVEKLLKDLSPNKASGPDAIPNSIIRGVAHEISPFMARLFNESLKSGDLPKDWTQANVTPIYKKGSRHEPGNYRPVSLTVVSCKILEHIVCKHILNHLEEHGLLTELNSAWIQKWLFM